MPCLIVTGYPSAGKTTLSKLLRERALLHSEIEEVVLLNEASACPDHTKNDSYANSKIEKQTRSALKSAFDRAVGQHQQQQQQQQRTLVILDSLNYIKGFRYELHCISKASGERHGVLWVLNRTNIVEEWNSKRDEKEAFKLDLLRELIQRYEPPDERNRWDKPLYTVDLAPAGTQSNDSKFQAVQKSVYNMHALGESLGDENITSTTSSAATIASNPPAKKSAFTRKAKKSAFSRAKPKTAAPATTPESYHEQQNQSVTTLTPSTPATETPNPSKKEEQSSTKAKSLEEQLDEILDSFLLKNKPLKEGNSTRQCIAGDANVLQELDSTTQRLISAIISAQNFHTGGKLQLKTNSGIPLQMNCSRRVALPELRRLRKQYLTWVSSNPPNDSTEKGIATSFLKYLEEQL